MTLVTPPLALGAPAFTHPGADGGGHISVVLAVMYVMATAGFVIAVIWNSSKRHRPGPDPGDGPGRGRGPKLPPPDLPFGPRGGIPLNDALPARVRLRGAVRLADALPARPRRQVREPRRRPARERTPV